MGVSAGTRLGPYEIVAAIGAGGMGEVYKARDTRPQRDVALKILPDIVTADPDVSLQERGHWWPNVLPDNRHVLFTIWRATAGMNDSRVAVLDLTTGRHTVLFPGARAQYVRPGRPVYFHAGAWHLIGFDPATQRTIGSPMTTATRAEGGSYELWMYDVSRKTEDRLAIAGTNFGAVWSSSGDTLAFTSIRKGDFDVYTIRADGTGERAILLDDFDQSPTAWDREGRRPVVNEWHHDASTPTVAIDTMHPEQRDVLVAGGISAEFVTLSSDNRWLAYQTEPERPPRNLRAALSRCGRGGARVERWRLDAAVVAQPAGSCSIFAAPGVRVILNWSAEFAGKEPGR